MTAGDVIVVSEDGSGKKGNYFDGTDDYVLHDAHAVARVAANDTLGTYTAWIYIDSLTTTRAIFSAGDNNSTDQVLELLIENGALTVLMDVGGVRQFKVAETTGSIVAKTWQHVALAQNGTRPILFVDGVEVAMTDATATDLTPWYDELTAVDKFAIGVKESNATHTHDWLGAIGMVRYYAGVALSEDEIKRDMADSDTLSDDTVRQAALDTALVFNVTMENDGVTDSGSGADNGTLTGHAHYGGKISDHSYQVEANSSGHAAEFINTFIDGNKYVSIIKRGD